MTSYDDIEKQMLDDLNGRDFDSDDAATILKNLKLLHEAKPESWLEQHSESLIKAGGTITVAFVIVSFESIANGVIRSKAVTLIR